jgi:hypothetical protein
MTLLRAQGTYVARTNPSFDRLEAATHLQFRRIGWGSSVLSPERPDSHAVTLTYQKLSREIDPLLVEG